VLTREVTFPREAYSADAIQRAAYRLSDRLSLELGADYAVYRCTVTLAVEDGAAADALLAEFRNEALDQVLRERIRLETEESRNLILALAFSGTGLVADE
jgi:His-Xaa-Ser system protein HxsD